MFFLTREVDQPIMVLYVNLVLLTSSYPGFLGVVFNMNDSWAWCFPMYGNQLLSPQVPGPSRNFRSSCSLRSGRVLLNLEGLCHGASPEIWTSILQHTTYNLKTCDCMEIPHKWRLIAGIIIGKLLNILQKWRFVAGKSHRKIWGTLGIAEARHAETKPWICLALRWKPWLVQAGESQWDAVNLAGPKKKHTNGDKMWCPSVISWFRFTPLTSSLYLP